MNRSKIILFFGLFLFLRSPFARGDVQYVIPGEANIWLSGMPVGTTASPGDITGPDVSPDQAPTQAVGLNVNPMAEIGFVVSGGVSRGDWQISHPDGLSSTPHLAGTEHGICGITAPFQCLIGVFLGPDKPDLTPAAQSLSFTSISSRDGSAYSPSLKQPFFIGDGKNSLGKLQKFKVPAGATRLFLGSNDSYGWRFNKGIFVVSVVTNQIDQEESISVSMTPSIKVAGQVGASYRVEVSTDLKEWSVLSRVVLTGNPTYFYDQQTDLRPKKFYRLTRDPIP